MATGTFIWYTKGSRSAMDAQFDWVADTMKVVLLTSAYTPAKDTHDFLNDVLANEITNVGGTAYNARNGDATGGYTLATKTVDDTTTTRVTVYGAANLAITASGGSLGAVKYYAVFKETSTLDGSDCALLGYGTVDTEQTATDGNTFTIDFSSGVCKTTAAG